jgi:hypothetical protein
LGHDESSFKAMAFAMAESAPMQELWQLQQASASHEPARI